MKDGNISIPDGAIRHNMSEGTSAYVWPTGDGGFHAVRADFKNIQESACGIADTPKNAIILLKKLEAAKSAQNADATGGSEVSTDTEQGAAADDATSEGDNTIGGDSEASEATDEETADQEATAEAVDPAHPDGCDCDECIADAPEISDEAATGLVDLDADAAARAADDDQEDNDQEADDEEETYED